MPACGQVGHHVRHEPVGQLHPVEEHLLPAAPGVADLDDLDRVVVGIG
jgi:hypothetical protein